MGDKKRLTIAVFVGDTYTAYATELINGFYACARKEQVNLIFLMRSSLPRDTNTVISDMTGDEFQVHFSSIYDYVPLIKPDALILAYGSLNVFSDTPDKELLLSYYRDIPCLLLKTMSDHPDVPCLVADNYSGMYECIEHLVSVHGYKKIAYLGGPANNHDSNERLRGYRDVMNKYGLPVTDTMIAHGDYSEFVDAQVNTLLDANPGLEAIAFANDNMAKTGYRICNERGLIVGRDLAITGFDDVDFAKTMYPPLTSVMHNSFLYSYQAIKDAIQMCRGNVLPFHTLQTVLHTRSSCGCSDPYIQKTAGHSTREEMEAFICTRIDQIIEDFFFTFPYQEEKKKYKEQLHQFFNDVIGNIFEEQPGQYNFNTQLPYLKTLCEHPRISSLTILDHLLELLKELVSYAPNQSVHDTLQEIMVSTQQYVLSEEISGLRSNAMLNLHQTWFANSFTQDLQAANLSFEESMRHIMNRLKLMHIESGYFFLRSEPAEYEKSYYLQAPEDLYLAAYYNNDTIVPLKREDWIPVDREKGISAMLSEDEDHLLTTHVLFSGSTQYGFLMCENAAQDIPFVAVCCLQIGSFLRYYNLNENEQRVRKELEASLQLIKEQNSILNFISEYDELTSLLNRRGFMEKSLRTLNRNIGRTAYILFADLDHLKEINDCFGHSAGDFALKTVADYLRDCLPDDAIIARISGDEFVSFVITDIEDFEQVARMKIQERCDRYNRTSDKPYYIELSVGISSCVCDTNASIPDLLHQSDTVLYAEKAHRRRSALKHPEQRYLDRK